MQGWHICSDKLLDLNSDLSMHCLNEIFKAKCWILSMQGLNVANCVCVWGGGGGGGWGGGTCTCEVYSMRGPINAM